MASTSGVQEVLAVVPVAPGPGATVYARKGDWFGAACPLGSALLLLALIVARLRRPSTARGEAS